MDHGGEFLNLHSEGTFESYLYNHLNFRRWTVESIDLLLRRGADPKIHFYGDSSLHLAIENSSSRSAKDIKDVLVLFIRHGADVYAKDSSGRSVSSIVSDKGTIVSKPWDDVKCYNSDLQLRKVWAEALTTCGYDTEEVISSSLRIEALSENETEIENDESVDTTDAASARNEANHSEDAYARPREHYAASEIEDDSTDEAQNDGLSQELDPSCIDDGFREPPDNPRWTDDLDTPSNHAAHNSYDPFLLEEDTNVWRN